MSTGIKKLNPTFSGDWMEQDFFGQYLKKKKINPPAPNWKLLQNIPNEPLKKKIKKTAKVWHRANSKVWEICVVEFESKSFFNGIIIYIWLTFFFPLNPHIRIICLFYSASIRVERNVKEHGAKFLRWRFYLLSFEKKRFPEVARGFSHFQVRGFLNNEKSNRHQAWLWQWKHILLN